MKTINKKHIHQLKLSLVCLPLFFMGVGCSDFLSEELSNGLEDGSFYKTERECEAAVTGCYSYLSHKDYQHSNWYGAYQTSAIMTDELSWSPANKSTISHIAYAQHDEKNDFVYHVWKGSYAAIGAANMAIQGIETSTVEEKNSMIAEVKFLRALFYFKLVRFFGDIPLYEKPVNGVDEMKIARSPKEDVYSLIIADLEYGTQNLPVKSEIQQAGQATQGAAYALLAKVYAQMAGYPLLQTEKWTNCRDAAKAVIDLTGGDGYELLSDYFMVFHPNSDNNKESIFEVQFAEGDVYGHNLGCYFSGVGGNAELGGRGAGYTSVIVKEHHLSMYKTVDDVQDPRYLRNIGNYSMPKNSNKLTTKINNTSIYTIKKFAKLDTHTTGYANGWGRVGNPTNVPVIRLSDIYLLYAEALNEIGQSPTADAYEYINKVRRRAWAKPINTADTDVDLTGLDYAQFRAAIMDERSVELCFEGHRWFDLVRWEQLEEKVKATTQPAAANISEKHYYFPIPQAERVLNPMLTQNPGWAGGSDI